MVYAVLMVYGLVSLPTWAMEARRFQKEMAFGRANVSWISQEALKDG